MQDSEQRRRERLIAAGCLDRAAPLAAYGTPRELAAIEDCLELLWHLVDGSPEVADQTAPLHARIAALVSQAGHLHPDADSGLVGGVLELADYALGLVDGEEPNPLMVAYRTEEVWTLFDTLLGEEVWYEREEAVQAQVEAALDAGADADAIRAMTRETAELRLALADVAARHGWTMSAPPAV